MLDNTTIFILLSILLTILIVVVYREQIADFFRGVETGLKKVPSAFDYSTTLSKDSIELDIEGKQKKTEGKIKVLINGLQRPSDDQYIPNNRVPAPSCNGDQCGGFDPLKNKKEVFLVSDNKFTFAEAEPLCKAYGASLATLEQIQDAYKNGADWCNYGWIKGQMAVYPTQPDTYHHLQTKNNDRTKNKCGKIGINGGKFPENRRFGVHCFGPKPATWKKYEAKCKLTKPLTPEELQKKRKAKHMRKHLDSYTLKPFNKQYWAEKY